MTLYKITFKTKGHDVEAMASELIINQYILKYVEYFKGAILEHKMEDVKDLKIIEL